MLDSGVYLVYRGLRVRASKGRWATPGDLVLRGQPDLQDKDFKDQRVNRALRA